MQVARLSLGGRFAAVIGTTSSRSRVARVLGVVVRRVFGVDVQFRLVVVVLPAGVCAAPGAESK